MLRILGEKNGDSFLWSWGRKADLNVIQNSKALNVKTDEFIYKN